MKKRYFYMPWAKALVAILLIASAIFAGLSGAQVTAGYKLGVTMEEMQTGVYYEDSSACARYLLSEGKSILLSAIERVGRGEAVDDSEVTTNAMLFVRDVNTNAVYTNIAAWSDEKLLSVTEAYEAHCSTAGTREAYYYYADKTAESDGRAVASTGTSIEEAGASLLKEVQNQLGSDGVYEVFLALDTTYPLQTSISATTADWMAYWSSFNVAPPMYMLFFAILLVAFFLVLLTLQAGRKADGSKQTAPIDAFPLELMLLMDVLLWVLLIAVAHSSATSLGYCATQPLSVLQKAALTFYAQLVVCAVLFIALVGWECKRYSRRIKCRTLGGSLIHAGVRAVRTTRAAMDRAQLEIQRTVLSYIVFVVVQILLLCPLSLWLVHFHAFALALLFTVAFLLTDVYVLLRSLKEAAGRAFLRKGMAQLCEGNLDYQVDTAGMFGTNLAMAEELNRVREGVRRAVDAEMKSERLKTDLITNVSHDIKTPLTSIINYVDILKREQFEDERIAGYVDILEQKAARLKTLTDDLVEAAKISSGNISRDLLRIDVTQLLQQVVGEFEEKFSEKDLQLLTDLPKEEMPVCVDGQRLWRILENLLSNAAQYSMANSRVYVTAGCAENEVFFSIKNISQTPLNFSADELLERFVRGDVSRSSEGSGLGLEIARNLTRLLGGKFDLYLDGDLFKVTVSFPRADA